MTTKQISTYLLFSLIFLAVSYLSFYRIFEYGLCCDDTLAIYNSVAYGTGQGLHYLFAPYGGQVFFISYMYKYFGLQANYFMITNFVLRLLTAMPVFFMSYQLTKNKLTAFLGTLLFTVSYSGIGTAEYSHQANIFFAVSSLTVGLGLLFKQLQQKQPIFYHQFITNGIIISFIGAAVLLATVRVNSIIFYLAFIELLFWWFQRTSWKQAAIRYGLLVVGFLYLKKMGSFGGSSPYHLTMIQDNLRLTVGSFDTLVHSIYYLTAIYADLLIPPIINSWLIKMLSGLGILTGLQNYAVYLLLAILMFIITWISFRSTQKLWPFLLSFGGYLMYLYFFYWSFGTTIQSLYLPSIPLNQTGTFFYLINSLLSGLIIFILIDILLILYLKKQLIPLVISILLASWPLFFMTVTFLFSPRTFYFDTFPNYLVSLKESYVHYYYVPALGIALLLPYLLLQVAPILKSSFRKTKWYTPLATVVVSSLILANGWSIHNWIIGQMSFRSDQVIEQAVNTVNQQIQPSIARTNKPIVYFESTSNTDLYYPYVITEWGFAPFRYALINHNNSLYPIFVSDKFENASTVLSDPTFIKSNSLTDPINLDDVYFFKIENGQVISQTEQIRPTLSSSDKL